MRRVRNEYSVYIFLLKMVKNYSSGPVLSCDRMKEAKDVRTNNPFPIQRAHGIELQGRYYTF